MDDGLSSVNPSINFDNLDYLTSTIACEEENAHDEDALRREQQIEDDLKNAFDDLIDEEASDSSENESGDLSNENDSYSEDSHHDSESRKDLHSEQYQLHNVENSSYSHTTNHSASYQFRENPAMADCYSTNSQLYGNTCTDKAQHSHKDFVLNNHSYESKKESDFYDVGHSSVIHSSVSNFSNCPPEPKCQSGSSTYASDLNSSHNEKTMQSDPVSSNQYSDAGIDIQEEYMKLQLLYQTRGEELKQLKMEEKRMKESLDQEVRNLSTRLSLIEGEKERLSSKLQEAQSLINDYRHENNVLQGKLNAFEIQLSAEREAKIDAMSKLQSSEINIQSLQQQIKDLTLSENGLRLKKHHESIVQDLKLRHQKEVLSWKENIDDLQKKLNAKVAEAESFEDKLSQLQRKCEELQVEKGEIFNKLSANLEASQRQCQKLLESGTIPEMSILKLQMQHLEDEKLKLENENQHLKEEIKSLETELQTSEALQKFTSNNTVAGKGDCDSGVQLSEKKRPIQEELERAVKNLRSQRSLNQKLKKEVAELKHQLPVLEEKAKLFESRFADAQKKAKDLEQKLNNLCPEGSISVPEHENKIRAIESELIESENRLRDATERLKTLSVTEDKLVESNKHLQTEIAEMVKKFSYEKLKAVEKCREKCMELHESAMKKTQQQLLSRADQDLKAVRRSYENKITQFQEEIKVLNNGLYEAKAEYINVCDENKVLRAKIENISKPKEMRDIEAEVAVEYEAKISKLKEQLQKQNKEHLEQQLRCEMQQIQEDWTKQKMIEIKDFVNNTKKQLDEEFQKCLEKEHKDFQNQLALEKAKYNQEYQEKLNSFRKQYDDERKKLISAMNEGSLSKSKAAVIELQQKHDKEMTIMKEYETKIVALERNLSQLQDELLEKQANFEKVNVQFKDELLAQKDKWEKEKLEYADLEFRLREKINATAEQEKKLREKVKIYQRRSSAVEKNYKEKLTKLQSQLKELEKVKADKQNHIQYLEKRYRQDILDVSERFRKHEASVRNSESQTEDQVISKKSVVYMQEMFISSLKNISDEIQEYLKNLRIRSSQRLQDALCHYHTQLSSKIFQDVSRSTLTFSPSICIPRVINSGTSINARRTFSSPASSDPLSHQNYNSPYSSDVFLSREHVHSTELKTAKTSSMNLNHKHPSKSTQCDTAVQFENVSFDFVPFKLTNPEFIANNMPNDFVSHGGLFSKETSVKSSFL